MEQRELLNYSKQTETLVPKYETLDLVDRLIEENRILKFELEQQVKRLRRLQLAMHTYLSLPDSAPAKDLLLQAATKENI